MEHYILVKWLHILSSTLLFGTGLGIAFFFWMAHLRGDARVIAATGRTVIIADACFTAPAVVVQLASGVWMTVKLGLPLSVFWLKAGLILFCLVGVFWLPVLWIQVRAQQLAAAAAASAAPLPHSYRRLMRWWFWLGWPAFISVMLIFWLMVRKPVSADAFIGG